LPTVRDTMKSMNDTAQTPLQSPISTPQQQGGSSLGKEAETISGQVTMAEVPHITEIGKDIDLPKEVSAVGVSVHPTTVVIPPKVSSMGVKPAGNNVTIGDGSSIALPLSDDLILQGLKQNPTSSWRYLAEWCKRRLLQMHRVIRTISGRPVEVHI